MTIDIPIPHLLKVGVAQSPGTLVQNSNVDRRPFKETAQYGGFLIPKKRHIENSLETLKPSETHMKTTTRNTLKFKASKILNRALRAPSPSLRKDVIAEARVETASGSTDFVEVDGGGGCGKRMGRCWEEK